MNDWQPVIGLEIHAQLNTKTKLFSSAPNRFGDEPNVNISAVCTGQPGALPVINQEAVRKAVQFGLAIGADIAKISTFDRKSYFYPDCPRGFRITQFENPLLRGGQIRVNGTSFKISRTQLEDDAGMLKHFSNFAGVDYNRAGAPLIEIVTEACIHTPEDATLCAAAVRTLLLYLDASDGNMEEGSLRIDANVSVRLKGETDLRPRIEIKNLNSFTFLELAIKSEIARQIELYETHPTKDPLELITPSTYRFDPEQKKGVLMRKKKSADDYRYFPEPDLTPLVITDEYIDQIRNELPALPRDRYKRYISDLGLSTHAAIVLINEKIVADYFEEALHFCNNPRLLCNWITIEFAGKKNILEIPPSHIAKLVQFIDDNKITGKIAKKVADEMVLNPNIDPEQIIAHNPDYQPIDDPAIIEQIVNQVLRENPQTVADYQAGKEKALDFLVGAVMNYTSDKASPKIVHEILRKKIAL